MKNIALKFVNIFKWYEWLFLFIGLAVLIFLGVYYSFSAVEIISVILGFVSASLNGKKKKYAFISYSAYVILYGIYAFTQKMYGEGILNLCINLPMYLYTLFGFYIKPHLKKKKKDEKESAAIDSDYIKNESSDFKIKQLTKGMIIGIIIFIPIVTGVYGYILSLMESNYPYLNALSTAIAICAVFLASKTVLWQWIFWGGYAICGLTIWSLSYFVNQGGGLLYIVLNILFLIVNAYCQIIWLKDYKNQEKLSETDEALECVKCDEADNADS